LSWFEGKGIKYKERGERLDPSNGRYAGHWGVRNSKKRKRNLHIVWGAATRSRKQSAQRAKRGKKVHYSL